MLLINVSPLRLDRSGHASMGFSGSEMVTSLKQRLCRGQMLIWESCKVKLSLATWKEILNLPKDGQCLYPGSCDGGLFASKMLLTHYRESTRTLGSMRGRLSRQNPHDPLLNKSLEKLPLIKPCSISLKRKFRVLIHYMYDRQFLIV